MRGTLALVGGAGLGAGLMYLLDPERGERRRSALSESVAYAVNDAADRFPALAGVAANAVAGARQAASRLETPRFVSDLTARLDAPRRAADLTEAARAVSAADLALVRVETGEDLETVAVAGLSALAAELDGTRLPARNVPSATVADLVAAPEAIRYAAGRAGARSVLVIPVRTKDCTATLELYRAAAPFAPVEQFAAELASGLVALVLRAFGSGETRAADAARKDCFAQRRAIQSSKPWEGPPI